MLLTGFIFLLLGVASGLCAFGGIVALPAGPAAIVYGLCLLLASLTFSLSLRRARAGDEAEGR
jgi:uncharacterized membrane protein YtjA (UPF0391 family)